jgi:hypothetical protein
MKTEGLYINNCPRFEETACCHTQKPFYGRKKALIVVYMMWISLGNVLRAKRDIIDWRCKHLGLSVKPMFHFLCDHQCSYSPTCERQLEECVFFIDEIWVNSNLTFRICWQRPVTVMDTEGGSNKLFIFQRTVFYQKVNWCTKQTA